MNKKTIEDHLGNKFESVATMCRFWGIDRRTYQARIKLGWSVERALTTPVGENEKGKTVTDHLGNEFKSIEAMCKFWNIKRNIYVKRIRRGWSVEDALTTPVDEVKAKGKMITDHLGNEFETITAMCKFWGIEKHIYGGRIKRGWSVEKALTTPVDELKKAVTDHLGNKFKSITAMCKFWGIDKPIYDGRIKLGWSVERTLTTPVDELKKTVIDHLGNEFESIITMCKFWGIDRSTYQSRIDSGWTLEEALTIPTHMYIGEYRVAEKLKKMHKKFYHDCTIKVIFEELDITVDWKDFLNELQKNLGKAGYNRSVQKIQILRPDFVVYTDEDNKIQGVIEFDGEQHQNFVEFFYKTIEQFYKRNNADMAKQSLFEYLNIPMLRIRHDQVDLIDEMVEDFIEFPENYITRHNTYLTEDEYWSILREEKKKLDLVFA